MDDIQHPNDFTPLTNDQIRDLADAIRDVFGSNLLREDFSDKLLLFLEDAPGYESSEAAAEVIEAAWAAYANPPGDMR
ncbi:hypothetical protein [Paraburkholderia sp. 2C]